MDKIGRERGAGVAGASGTTTGSAGSVGGARSRSSSRHTSSARIKSSAEAVRRSTSFTSTRSSSRPTYTKHVVVDRTHLQYRPYAGARARQRPLLNRDIQRLFEPLRVTENILLKTNLREVLFRKSVH